MYSVGMYSVLTLFLPSSVYGGSAGALAQAMGRAPLVRNGTLGKKHHHRTDARASAPIPPLKNEGYHSRHGAFAPLWLKPHKWRKEDRLALCFLPKPSPQKQHRQHGNHQPYCDER